MIGNIPWRSANTGVFFLRNLGYLTCRDVQFDGYCRWFEDYIWELEFLFFIENYRIIPVKSGKLDTISFDNDVTVIHQITSTTFSCSFRIVHHYLTNFMIVCIECLVVIP